MGKLSGPRDAGVWHVLRGVPYVTLLALAGTELIQESRVGRHLTGASVVAISLRLPWDVHKRRHGNGTSASQRDRSAQAALEHCR
jgi:hypothetical protein